MFKVNFFSPQKSRVLGKVTVKMFQGHEGFPNCLMQQVNLGLQNPVCRFLVHLIYGFRKRSILVQCDA